MHASDLFPLLLRGQKLQYYGIAAKLCELLMVDVYLTIDTECSMGGAWDNPQLEPVAPERAILGKIGAQYYGTPLIMDILEESGLRGTFFIEVLATHVVPD